MDFLWAERHQVAAVGRAPSQEDLLQLSWSTMFSLKALQMVGHVVTLLCRLKTLPALAVTHTIHGSSISREPEQGLTELLQREHANLARAREGEGIHQGSAESFRIRRGPWPPGV